MSTDPKHTPATRRSPNSDKAPQPDSKGGNAVGNARSWGGGSKASKGNVTEADKHNENSSART